MDALLDFFNTNRLIILGGTAGGLLGLLLSYGALEKIFRMLRASTGEIGTFPAGEQVEIVGTADGQSGLRSPITQTPCVFWQVLVTERRSSGRSSRWVTVYSNSSTEPFDVYDGTARMRVIPGPRMDVILRDDVKKTSGLFNAMDEQTQTALNAMGVGTKGLLNLNKTMRVHERFIEQGDQIYLLGRTSLHQGARVMDTSAPLIVSDQSELSLLGKFLWQAAANVLLGIMIGVVAYLTFVNH